MEFILQLPANTFTLGIFGLARLDLNNDKMSEKSFQHRSVARLPIQVAVSSFFNYCKNTSNNNKKKTLHLMT